MRLCLLIRVRHLAFSDQDHGDSVTFKFYNTAFAQYELSYISALADVTKM